MLARSKIFALLSAGVTAALIAGCASRLDDNANGAGVSEMRAEKKNSAIRSQDMVAMTDKMARGIMAVPEIANAQKPPRIVLLPVKNGTPFPFNKDTFLDEITARLNEYGGGKARFAKQIGQGTSETDPNTPQVTGADFLLTGRLAGQTTRTSAGTTDYVLYSFELINPNTKEIIWNGSHRLKKQGQTEAVYR